MRTYLVIGMVCSALLVSSCGGPADKGGQFDRATAPMPPPAAYRVCMDDEDPAVNNCKKEGPTSTITVRGHHE